MDELIIEGRDIFKSFDKHEVLKGVSLSIYKGRSTALVGKSGGGKSTLARILLNLIKPDRGDVFYRGEKLSNVDNSLFRRKCQIVFQDPQTSLNPKMTIEATLCEPMVVHNVYKKEERKKEAVKLLNMVNLQASYLSRYPSELSGGERQRIGIARALALSPEFVVLDEPVSSLDVTVQIQLLDLLKNLEKETGVTFLFITHDLGAAKYLCHDIVKLVNGIIEI